MNLLLKVILGVLVFLAVSSGMTKIMLMEQDVRFFGSYGFTDTTLIAFGISQFIGGCLLALERTRLSGAVIVALTFLLSGVLLVLEGNMFFSFLTFASLIMLGVLVKQREIRLQIVRGRLRPSQY